MSDIVYYDTPGLDGEDWPKRTFDLLQTEWDEEVAKAQKRGAGGHMQSYDPHTGRYGATLQPALKPGAGEGKDPKPVFDRYDLLDRNRPGSTEKAVKQILSLGRTSGSISADQAKRALHQVQDYDGPGNAIFVGLDDLGLRRNVKYLTNRQIGWRMSSDPEFQRWVEKRQNANDDDFVGTSIFGSWDFMDRTGERYRGFEDIGASIASTITRKWAAEAADSDSTALFIQTMAHRVFDTDAADHKAMLSRSFHDIEDPAAKHNYQVATANRIRALIENDGPVVAAYHRAVYAETQQLLADAGISQMTVFRGAGIDNRFANQNTFEAAVNPLSSWTTHRATAWDFSVGYDHPAGQTGAVVATTVPASQIYSTPFTGFGCLNEAEIVLVNASGSTVRRA